MNVTACFTETVVTVLTHHSCVSVLMDVTLISPLTPQPLLHQVLHHRVSAQLLHHLADAAASLGNGQVFFARATGEVGVARLLQQVTTTPPTGQVSAGQGDGSKTQSSTLGAVSHGHWAGGRGVLW